MKWPYVLLAVLFVGSVLSLSPASPTPASSAATPNFTGSPSQSPFIDGSYWNGTGNCGTVGYTNCSAILTTTSSPDLVVVFGQTESLQSNTCAGLPPVVSLSGVTDASGLTWHLRKTVTSSPTLQSGWCYQFHIEEWYAIAGTTLSGDKIEIHDSSGLLSGQYLALMSFGVGNVNPTEPFDPNPGAECTNAGVGTTFSCSVSTSNPNDLIIGGPDFYFGSFSYGSGYQAISPAFGPDCSTEVDVSCSEYQQVSSVQTGLAVSYTQASSAIFVLIGDSIEGISSGSSSTSSTSSSSSFAASSSTASSGSVWWVGAESTDSSALPNTGVEASISVIDFTPPGCLAFWVADALTNNEWGQVGYYLCNGNTPVAFYQVWDLSTNTILGGGTGTVSAGTHAFSMYLQSGTTWAFAMDGSVFGTYNMGASGSSSTYPVEALSEEQSSSVFSFPSVTFSTAMEVLKSGSWTPVQTATSYGTAYGVQGNLQNSGLAEDEIVVGGSLSALGTGTVLWSSGASSTTTSSSTSLAPPTVTVTSTSTYTVTSTDTSTQTVTQTTVSTTTQTLPGTTTTTTVTTTSPVTTTQTYTTTLPGTTTTSTVTSTVPVTTTETSTTTSTTTRTSTVSVTSTDTSTQTMTSTITSGTTATVTSTGTQTVTSTKVSSVTSTVTSTTTETKTSSTTVTSTQTGGTTTSTSTETVTQTQTVGYPPTATTTVTANPTVTLTTTVVSTAQPSTTTITSIGTTTTTQTTTTDVPTTTTVTSTVTVTRSGNATATASPGQTVTSTTTLPASTTTVTLDHTVTSTQPKQTVTSTTVICLSSKNGAVVSCSGETTTGNDSNAAVPPITTTGVVVFLMIAGSAALIGVKKVFFSVPRDAHSGSR